MSRRTVSPSSSADSRVHPRAVAERDDSWRRSILPARQPGASLVKQMIGASASTITSWDASGYSHDETPRSRTSEPHPLAPMRRQLARVVHCDGTSPRISVGLLILSSSTDDLELEPRGISQALRLGDHVQVLSMEPLSRAHRSGPVSFHAGGLVAGSIKSAAARAAPSVCSTRHPDIESSSGASQGGGQAGAGDAGFDM